MTTFTDDFAGTGALSASWETPTGAAGALTRNSDTAYATNSTDVNASSVTTAAATFAADQSAQLTYKALGTGDFGGPAVRVNAAAGTGYGVLLDGVSDTARRLARFTGIVTQTIIGTVNIGIVANDIIKVKAIGTNISVYKNGSLVETVSDATYASGQPGMLYNWTNVRATTLDDFNATDSGGGGSPPASYNLDSAVYF